MLTSWDFVFVLDELYPEATNGVEPDEVIRRFNKGAKDLHERLKKAKKEIYFTPQH